MHDTARNLCNAFLVYCLAGVNALAGRCGYRAAANRQEPPTRLLYAAGAMSLVPLILTLAACSGDAGAVTAPDGGSRAMLDTILVEVPSTEIPVGKYLQLAASVIDEFGGAHTDIQVSWQSSDPTVATVSESGKVTGVAKGKVTINASASQGRRRGGVRLDVTNGVTLAAFPDAEGWGAVALNQCRSRPVEVLRVTNTNSDGAGSLAQAVREARSDFFSFIVFETGGHFKAPPDHGIRLNSSCVYIAGQTAPGDGVVIQGQPTAFWLRGGGGNIGDIVMRYLRFRGKSGETNNNLIIAKGERIVLDHMSFSWTDNYILSLLRYGGMTFSGPIAEVSIQNSIASEVFGEHPTGPVFGTNEALKTVEHIYMTNVALHRNLWAHNSHRNPMTAADNIVVANNVIYNWSNGAGMMNRRGVADWVNNYGKAGPMTREESSYIVNAYCDDYGGDFSIFAAGNIGPMSDDPQGDNWSGSTRQVACYHNTGEFKGQEVPSEWRRDTEQAWRSKPFPVTLLPALDAYAAVLDDVGADERLKCDGTWIPALDAVDSRVISETRNGSGVSRPPENELEVGGYPSYATGVPCEDADRDGLPDAWEQRFFQCETCADRAAVGRKGYLVIEHYLNGTKPQ